MSLPFQPGIAADVPSAGRYLFFSLTEGASAEALGAALRRLAPQVDGTTAVAGLGPQVAQSLGRQVPGQREFPSFEGAAVSVPRTPTALWLWLRSTDTTDRGDLVLAAQAFETALAPVLRLDRVIDGFRHGRGPNGHGRDLTGYEDGTENPDGDAAEAAAFVRGQGEGLDGSSFVAVQQWVHDFAAFQALPPERQDDVMGRRRVDNEELEDAPESAHVKRTAQEDFDPEAFVLRRSMPWAQGSKAGLMFVAFGCSHDAYEAQMRRMAGLDDGITDALFTISHPVNGAYFWCPPLREGGLDLRRLGL